jgi:2-amino-4-hydroxy-6-hydroxymethyldihydropteridine diphosphokinase
MSPVTAYVALGANLGDPRQAVLAAMDAIDAFADTTVMRRSPLYRTAPVEASGSDYVNAVIEVSTIYRAPHLLNLLQKIEQNAGRLRPYANAPRTLDLDILLYGSAQISSARLTIPHPRMLQRAFVMLPLSDIAPKWAAHVGTPELAGQRADKIESIF